MRSRRPSMASRVARYLGCASLCRMSLPYHFAGARALRSASPLIAAAFLVFCDRAESPPAADTSRQSAPRVIAPPADSSTPSVVPESSPETMRAFAAAHLPPGKRHGDFLTDKPDYPTGDTADVYRAVLDTLYVSSDGFPGQVVLYDVATTRVVTCTRMPCPIVPRGTRSEPKPETLNAFRVATLTRRHITPRFKYHIPLNLLSEEGQRELEIDGRSIDARDSAAIRHRRGWREHPFWLGFQAKYPHAWGFAMLSTVGMNPQKNEAILQVGHRCGASCGSFETMILWKVRGRWHVIERVPEQSDSTDTGNESLRYRGVGAHSPLVDVRAQTRRDSIRAAELPRDIHGRITTRGGEPVEGAKITLHTGDTPNVPSAVAVSDPLGNYRFDNPPVGGAGLMVRCPRNTLRPDTLAAVTGADVGTGNRVEVNIPIDRAVCYDTTGAVVAQMIQPAINVPVENEFDAARAHNATYPSEDEAAVYRELLGDMGYPGPAEALVYATTRSPCTSSWCNEVYLRSIRHQPQVMMSAMENFLTVRAQRRDFRANFPGLRGMALVGDSALRVAERASGRGNALGNPALVSQAWPKIGTLLSLSPVGFSPHREQAIVEVMRADGGFYSTLGILNRTRNGWRVVGYVSVRLGD